MTRGQQMNALHRELAESERIRFALLDALIWCGGSSDFAPGGKARRGWLRGPARILGYLVGANNFPEPEVNAAPVKPRARRVRK